MEWDNLQHRVGSALVSFVANSPGWGALRKLWAGFSLLLGDIIWHCGSSFQLMADFGLVSDNIKFTWKSLSWHGNGITSNTEWGQLW